MSNAIDTSTSSSGPSALYARSWAVLCATITALGLGLLPAASGAVLSVTNDYPTIQAAIDAAVSNDTILVQAGLYRESLNILKSVRIIGSGYTNCIVHHTNDVLVTITSAGVVELAGMEICGGELGFGGYFSPTVPDGIVASNTTVTLNDVALNNTRNFSVTVVDGSLYATNVMLYTRIVLQQWDVGLQLKGCFARIYHLTQISGQIDHTVNINDPPANYSDVRVENSTIQASALGYGECIRTYTASAVVITNCNLYRAPGGAPVSIGNQAVGVNGYSNAVSITGNTFSNLPTGIRVFGSLPSSNRIKVEYNNFFNCVSNAVLPVSMPYEGIDLGGGLFQSAGLNYFSNPGARDVELSSSSGNVHAESNCWTTVNPDDSIWDKTDSPALGQVLYNPTLCEIVTLCALSPVIATNNVATPCTVIATVTTNSGPASGVNVSFSVSGANPGAGTNSVTDSNGQASFTYNGANTGSDTITATGSVGQVDFSAQATQVWLSTDTIPSITCPSDINTNTSAGACALILAYNVQATGTPPPVVTMNPPSGTSFSRGITGVTATASNAAGVVQCSFTVTVVDTQSPVFNGCPSNHLVHCYDEVPPAPTVTATDNCDTNVVVNFSQSESNPGSSCSNVITRTWTATDSNGNSNSCTQTILVYDTIVPVISCPAIVTTNMDADACSASGVVLGSVTATDNCLGSVTVTNNAPGSFPKGTNTVVWTATDSCGNSANCTQLVIVVDSQAPTITCAANITTNVPAGTISAILTYASPVVTDNCAGLVTVVCAPMSGSTFTAGVTTVNCTATDTEGNQSTCNFKVTLTDSDDLATTRLIAPRKIVLTGTHTNVFGKVSVTIQNRSARTELITDINTFTNLVTLVVSAVGSNNCTTPVPMPTIPKKFPITLKSKKTLTMTYSLNFGCPNAPNGWTNVYQYVATVHHDALPGGIPDMHSACDVCPRGPLATPGNRDPNPDGKIIDKGCGAKGTNGILGAAVLTTVIKK